MVESARYDLDLIFHALSDPTRRAILKKVSSRERTVTELARPFSMSLAAVSKHLKILDRARLIRRSKRGSFYYVTLNPEALMNAEQWLARYQRFWETRLDSLSRLLEKELK
jgi:DNA-binding transcriptional ArsR family regulator